MAFPAGILVARDEVMSNSTYLKGHSGGIKPNALKPSLPERRALAIGLENAKA